MNEHVRLRSGVRITDKDCSEMTSNGTQVPIKGDWPKISEFCHDAPGGAYYCITPNAVTGPHDISVYFDKVASGFHLKEYSYRELSRAFTGIGLRKQAVLFGHGAVNVLVPAKIGIMLEMVMQRVWRGRSRPTTNSVLRHLMGIRLLGYK